MEQVLAGLPTTVALLYLDYILVPGRTFEQQINNLQMVFQPLKEANLKLNPNKCNPMESLALQSVVMPPLALIHSLLTPLSSHECP